jgi:hypothetical protein
MFPSTLFHPIVKARCNFSYGSFVHIWGEFGSSEEALFDLLDGEFDDINTDEDVEEK